jgi:hypothetical protein
LPRAAPVAFSASFALRDVGLDVADAIFVFPAFTTTFAVPGPDDVSVSRRPRAVAEEAAEARPAEVEALPAPRLRRRAAGELRRADQRSGARLPSREEVRRRYRRLHKAARHPAHPTGNDAAMTAGATRSQFTARELLGCAALAVVLALAMHWPLPMHLGRDIAKDLGDPLVQAWQIAWDGHALTTQPLSLFQANMFWPLPDSLAFSDALVGYAPAGLVGHGVHAAVARYDLLFLFSYALCFAGAYLLSRELGAKQAGATVAGAAFAYAPWRLEQEGHLHIISSGAIPLALFLLLRGYRRGSAKTIVAGWLVATWQFSLGFSLGLPLAYLLAGCTAAVLIIWLRNGRPRPGRAVLVATAAGMVCFALVAGVLARPYMRVLHDHPEAHRTIKNVSSFSGPPYEFLVSSEDSRIWGAASKPLRDHLNFVPEQTLFPGLAILALALLGLRSTTLPRHIRRRLGYGALAFAILSLGFKLNGFSWVYPYRWLYELLPGWQGIRVPGRLHTLTTLCLALLAAGGAQALVDRARARGGALASGRAATARRGAFAAAATAAVLCVAVLAEGWGFADHPTVEVAPAGYSAAPRPALHLPAGAFDNRRYVLWSSDGFPDIVNGRGSFVPRQFQAVIDVTATFPDKRSVAALRRLGVRSVTVHLEHAGRPLAKRALDGSLRGLHLERQRRGGTVLFLLR